MSLKFLPKKDIEIFFKKTKEFYKIIADEKKIGLANIIKNMYGIWLKKNPKFAMINQFTT